MHSSLNKQNKKINSHKYFLSKKNGLKNIRIEGDSLLVINQVKGIWLVRDSTLTLPWQQIMNDIKDLEYVELKHIDRKDNTDADKVCNEVLDSFIKK